MRRRMLISLVGLLAIGIAGSARAATLDFTGTLSVQIARFPFPTFVVPGAGTAQVTDDGSFHLLSFALPGGAFGPINMSLPVTAHAETQSIWMTSLANLTGTFSGISGGPPGGGAMGLSGLGRICLLFATGCGSFVPFPLTPTAGGAGFGIGGTRTDLRGGVRITIQDAPWTIGQPVLTIHTPNSTITTPAFPGGFAHGPVSLTSSTARPSGGLQLVTVSKVFTHLTMAFPELPLSAVLTLHFVPEPGTLMLLGLGVAGLGAAGRRRSLL